MDWNGDGLDDLLVGEYNGHIKYFMAVTADSLTEMEDLKADGVYINAGLVGCPVVFDWNNDSLDDLLVGFASPTAGGSLQLYMNIGTPGNPVLDAAVDVFGGGQPLTVFGCTPYMADLNGDGLADLIYGETAGEIYYCQNTGTISSPVFSAPVQLESISGPMALDLNSAPTIADWNDDGFLDLVAGCGEAGYIHAFLSPYTEGISSSNENDGCPNVSLLSNPVSQSVTLSVSAGGTEDIEAELFSISGRRIADLGSREIYQGENTLNFSLPAVETGMYLLRISAETGSSTVHLTVLEGV